MKTATNVEITWQAFGNKPEKNRFVESASFDVLVCESEEQRLELVSRVYNDTNLYGGLVWEKIQPNLPENRTHTALSIGDKITIDYVHIYIVAEVGFVKISGLVD